MPSGLSVSESESIALKVISNTSPQGCGHRVIAYELDGMPKTLRTTTSLLGEPVTAEEAEQEFIIAWLRYRRARGKTEIDVRLI